MKKLSCVCLLDDNTTTQLTNLMNEVSSSYGTKSALAFKPHLTLRNDFEIEDKDLELLQSDLEDLGETEMPFELSFKQIGFYPWKIIYAQASQSVVLSNLHDKVMDVIQKYRTNWVSEVLLNSPHFEGKQKDYIVEYGYQFAFEYYSPHITIGGTDITDEAFEKAKTELTTKSIDITTKISSFSLLDRDNGNQVIKPIPLSFQEV